MMDGAYDYLIITANYEALQQDKSPSVMATLSSGRLSWLGKDGSHIPKKILSAELMAGRRPPGNRET